MGDIFKLKVTIGEANIELEGDGNLVHTIFAELREEGLGKLSTPLQLPKLDGKKDIEKELIEIAKVENNMKIDEKTNESSFELPNIRDIVIKDLPDKEIEWILIYSLYITKGGKDFFEADQLRQMYHDTNRYTDNRSKNFSTNVKKAVTLGWFNSINDIEYFLSEDGKKFAYEILRRTPDNKSNKKNKKINTTQKTSYEVIDLGVTEEKRNEIKEYILSFKTLSNIDKAVVIAYKLKEYSILEINENIIFTVLRIANLSSSYDIKASMANGKRQKNYFVHGDNIGTYKLHHLGEDHAKELEKERGNE